MVPSNISIFKQRAAVRKSGFPLPKQITLYIIFFVLGKNDNVFDNDIPRTESNIFKDIIDWQHFKRN
jgi:hypothetical protein